MHYKAAAVGLLAGLAASAPTHEVTTGRVHSANRANDKTRLLPAIHPDVNRADSECLVATHDLKLHYDSNPNPQVDSTVGTVTASGAPYPLVQLENSQYIQSVNCTPSTAQIQFTNQTAYNNAVADWSQHSQFVIISYDPQCGDGFPRDRRDYALVNKITPNDGSMVVDASIQFIDYSEAIGNKTLIHTTLGTYKAPLSKRISKTETFNIDWNEYPTSSLSDNQWGSGYQLLQSDKLDVICVGCGTQGALEFVGSFDYSIFSGLEEAQVSLTGTMQGQLAFGLDAHDVSKTIPIKDHEFPAITLPGAEIPGFLSVGPEIIVSVGADLELKATGTLLLGAALSWSNIDVVVDMVGENSQATGLSPSVTPLDSIQGTITATLDLHLPVSVGIGIDILDGTWEKSLSVVDTPGFQLSAALSNVPGQCTGIELSADVYNNVGVDLLDITTIGLASWTEPIFSTCIAGKSTTPTHARTTPVQSTGRPSPTTVRTTTVTRTTGRSPASTGSPLPPSSGSPISSPAQPGTTPPAKRTTTVTVPKPQSSSPGGGGGGSSPVTPPSQPSTTPRAKHTTTITLPKPPRSSSPGGSPITSPVQPITTPRVKHTTTRTIPKPPRSSPGGGSPPGTPPHGKHTTTRTVTKSAHSTGGGKGPGSSSSSSVPNSLPPPTGSSALPKTYTTRTVTKPAQSTGGGSGPGSSISSTDSVTASMPQPTGSSLPPKTYTTRTVTKPAQSTGAGSGPSSSSSSAPNSLPQPTGSSLPPRSHTTKTAPQYSHTTTKSAPSVSYTTPSGSLPYSYSTRPAASNSSPSTKPTSSPHYTTKSTPQSTYPAASTPASSSPSASTPLSSSPAASTQSGYYTTSAPASSFTTYPAPSHKSPSTKPAEQTTDTCTDEPWYTPAPQRLARRAHALAA